jgi:hypothetical protein
MKLLFDQANASPGQPTEVSVAYTSHRFSEWDDEDPECQWSISGAIQEEKFSSQEELFQKAETLLTPENFELLGVFVDFHVHQRG